MLYADMWIDRIKCVGNMRYYRYVQDWWEREANFPFITPRRQETVLLKILKDIRYMAKQSQPKSKGKGNETGKLYWVKCDIEDGDIPIIDKWIDSNVGDMLGYVCNIAENGVAVSLKSTEDGGYMCAAYGTIMQGNDRRGFGVSAFASSAGDALACLLYKYIVLLDNGRGIELPTEGTIRRMR